MNGISLGSMFNLPDETYPNGVKLLPMQATALQFLREREKYIGNTRYLQGAILGDDMGSGKSYILGCLIAVNAVKSTLFITPNGTTIQILERLYKICVGFSIYYIENQTLRKVVMKNGKRSCKIVTYIHNEEYFVLVTHREQLNSASFLRIVSEINFMRIIIDEAQDFRNETNYDKHLSKLNRQTLKVDDIVVPYCSIILSTGTPIENRIFDLVKLYRIINPSFFSGVGENGITSKMQELSDFNNQYLFRRSISNFTPELKVLMQLPNEDPEVHFVLVNPPETKLSKILETKTYDNILTYFERNRNVDKLKTDERAYIITLIAKKESNATTHVIFDKILLSNAFEGTNSLDIPYEGTNSKVEAVKRILLDHPNENFVIFYEYIITLNMYRSDFLENIGNEYNIRSIEGENKPAERHNILQECNNLIRMGKKVILFSSSRATSKGVDYNLFDSVIFVDHSANPQDENQAIARLQRMGQQNRVKVWFITYKQFTAVGKTINIDQNLIDKKDEKRDLLEILYPNAAYFFKQYKFISDDGNLSSGVVFPEEYERFIDTIGPDEIDEYNERLEMSKK